MLWLIGQHTQKRQAADIKQMRYVILLLLMLPLANAIRITEIMYNPLGSDNFEYIEIYSEVPLNLSGYIMGDLSSNDTLFEKEFLGTNYALIVTDSWNISANASTYSAGSKIGNGLNNDGDTIFFYFPNGTMILNISYTNDLANGNNRSIEIVNESFFESIEGGTPGFGRVEIEHLDDLSQNQSLNQTENNTQQNSSELINESSNDCDASIEISTEKIQYNDEAIKFRHIIKNASENYSITYWVEDSSGNIAKSKITTATLTEKSFTPSLKESDRGFYLKAELYAGCNDTNTSDNYAKKLVLATTKKEFSASETNKTQTQQKKQIVPDIAVDYQIMQYSQAVTNESSVLVSVTSDEEPHIFVVWSYIYRGSKKYSEESTEQFSLSPYETKLVELRNAINASTGDYKLKIKINKDAQKTDTEFTKNITVMPEQVQEKEEAAAEIRAEPVSSYKNSSEIVYQSPASKSKNMAYYAILGVLALISSVLIWKR